MNLYNIFEGLNKKNTDEDFNGLMMGVQEGNPIAGALADGSGVSATLGTDNDRSPLTQTEDDEFITENLPEVVDEVAMNPKAFAQAVKSGQDRGVLVGFEFETCIPKSAVTAWKSGGQATTPGYTPNSTAWIDGKTVADLFDGVKTRGDGEYKIKMEDLFKYKTSYKRESGYSGPWEHYTGWAMNKVNQWRNSTDSATLVFEALSELLSDPVLETMSINYMGSDVESKFGDQDQYNGKTFTLAVLKEFTGIDFSNKVPQSELTEDLAKKIVEAAEYAYRVTRGPYDSRVSRVAQAKERAEGIIRGGYFGRRNWDTTDEEFESVQTQIKRNFSRFCQEEFNTTDLKELLKTTWAFKGRVNNTSETLKEKLWYYLTPGAEIPASLRPRPWSIQRNDDYRDGADYLKANLTDVFGNMTVFTRYHQSAKSLDRWYIEPDGSLRPKSGDFSAEVVSPPLPAADAMAALQTWYRKAQELQLYTNNSTGLHINVSIPGNLDVLKLATFVGDEYVLKQFGREDNNYARSVLKSLQGKGSLPKVGSGDFKDAEAHMKELVRNISNDHFASCNFNGKYVSFRHAGKDYLKQGTEIANTVGRFIRSMIIASDPDAYRQEYISKLVKLMRPNEDDSDKLPLSDLRTYTSKGIPVLTCDLIVLPDNKDNLTQRDITRAVESIADWAKDRNGYNIEIRVVTKNDPSVRERLLNGRGFSSATKDWIQQAPDSMLLKTTIYPANRRALERFFDLLADRDQSAAFGIYGDGKRTAAAVKYSALVKKDDPEFITAIQALRGGAVKAAPLPGTKHAPQTQQPSAGATTRTDPESDDNSQEQTYNLVNAEDGEVLQHYHGSRNDTLRVAQSIANRMNHDVVLYLNGEPVDTARVQELDEARIFQPQDKFNVIYNPHNSSKKIIVAKAVDHVLANRVINSYVDRAERDNRIVTDKDFILQPVEYPIAREGQDGQGTTGAGGSVANDSTSPIHGFGENRNEKIAGLYDPKEFDAMVLRVGQKAKEQEKKKPVDLEKLAQRLRDVRKQIKETIRKIDAGYRLYSHTGKNLGTYPTKAGAERRERQVQYFKHANEDKASMSTASRELLRVARQSNPEATNNTDAVYAYLNNIAKKTQENYKKVNDILRQLDPLSTELDSTERELHDVEKVNKQQQDLLSRLSKRVDQVRKNELPTQRRAADAPAQQAANKAEKEREVIAKKLDEPKEPEKVHQVQQPTVPQPVDNSDVKKSIEDLRTELHALQDKINNPKVNTTDQDVQRYKQLQLAITSIMGDRPDAARKVMHYQPHQQELPFDESLYESRLYAWKRAGYDIE